MADNRLIDQPPQEVPTWQNRLLGWADRNAPEYLKESARSLYEGPRNRAQGLWDEFKDSRLSGQTAAGLGSTLDPVRMLPGANSGMLLDIPRTMYLSRFGTQELPAGTDVYKYSNAEDAAGQRFARENPETAQTIGASMEAQFSHPLGMGFVPHAVSRGADRAGNALMEHTPGPDQVNMFAGPKAKTADLPKLEQAQSLESAGHSPDTIWKETGWFKGSDGKWKFEIPDNEATLGFQGGAPRVSPYNGRNREFDALIHPQMEAAYGNGPSAKGSYYGPSFKDPEGAYFSAKENNGTPAIISTAPDEAGSISNLLHEHQHHIQGVEGYAQGGNSFNFDTYHRLAGETEARNVQARMNMTPEERLATPPWATQDVPNDQQIVRFGGDGPQHMFIGPKARTWNPELAAKAEAMEKAGHSPDEIWKATSEGPVLGTFRGADERLKQELSDHEATRRWWDGGKLSSVMDHPQLYDSYPAIGRIPVSKIEGMEGFGTAGTYQDAKPGNWLGLGGSKAKIEYSPIFEREDQLSTLLHEAAGHGIQDIEGFGKGAGHDADSSLDAASRQKLINDRAGELLAYYQQERDKLAGRKRFGPEFQVTKELFHNKTDEELSQLANKTANQQLEELAYKRSSGEVDARNIQDRVGRLKQWLKENPGGDPKEWAAQNPPWKTQDVPNEQQIVRFGNEGVQESRNAPGDLPPHLPRTPTEVKVYHGTGAPDFEKFNPRLANKSNWTEDSHWNEKGEPPPVPHAIALTEEPSNANLYAAYSGDRYKDPQKRVLPGWLEAKGFKEIDLGGKGYSDLPPEIKKAKDEGYPGLSVKNVLDMTGHTKRAPQTQHFTWTPNTLRSSLSNNQLYSAAPLALGALGAGMGANKDRDGVQESRNAPPPRNPLIDER